ncbi:putative Transmembrane protein with metallophosphoesterase domain [Blattamonas nauphoetae]|uniref:Transmembrane protein with metallophosphoesterase domain n=1 Tax=Blattamonas nauphoetae TaxID=2049346 RepID=A0ABQ9XCE4_9EUKA|nr:putative Transmembrane protein with metallophosphoesterase domain [Blattamonas nauphoetae]
MKKSRILLLVCIVPVVLCIVSYPLFRNLVWLFDAQVKQHPWLWGLFAGVALLVLTICVVFIAISQFSASTAIYYISRGAEILLFSMIDLLFLTLLMEILYGAIKPLRSHKVLVTSIVLAVVVVYQIVGHIRGNIRRKRNLKISSPRVQDSFRIVHLTDIHLGSHLPSRLKKIVAEVNKLNADLVCITGDLTDTRQIVTTNQPEEGSDRLLPTNAFYPLNELKSSSGVFFVSGNHDIGSGREELYNILGKCPNVKILSNESQIVKIPSKQTQIKLIGIEDGEAEYFVDSAKKLKGASPEDNHAVEGYQSKDPQNASSLYTVLLHHRPHKRVWRDVMHLLDVDMFLAGHTHAGQMMFLRPLVWLVHNPDVWLSTLDEKNKKENSSILSYDQPFMYVGPGTGTAGTSKRTSYICEITIFDVSPSSS